MKKAAKIIVKGTVQGLYFRNFVKESADQLELRGFVRNLENGSVEVVVEGEIDNVDKMHELCKTGPKNAIVKNVIMEEVSFQDLRDFKILHI